MTDTFTWSQLGVLMAMLGAGLTIWKIRSVDKQHYDDKFAAQDKALAEFKLHVATVHPTSKDVYELRNDLTNALNRLTDRIDRWLEVKK